MFVGRRMTRKVVTASPGDTIAKAAALLREHRIHHLPVVEGETLVGIVTDTDIRNAALGEPAGGEAGAGGRSVGETMIRQVVTVTPWDTVEDALLILHHRRFGALPVVEGKRLVGIVTKADVLGAFIETLDIEDTGVRIEAVLPAGTDALLRLIRTVGETGVGMKSLVVSPHRGRFVAFMRLATIDPAAVKAKLRGAGFEIPELSDFLE